MTASAAVSAFSTLLQISDDVAAPATGWTSIAEITNVSIALEGTSIEVTHMESTGAWKEFISGLKGATVTFGMNFIIAGATHVGLITQLSTTSAAAATREYRILWSDYGAVSKTATVITATNVWTAASNHGWQTGQRVKVTSSGTFPATNPAGGLISGGFAYIGRVDADEFKLYPTSADAVAGTNEFDFTSTGSGTHTITSGSRWLFSAQIMEGPTPNFDSNDRVSATCTLKVTGANTIEP